MLHLAPEGAISPDTSENRMGAILAAAVQEGRINVGETPTPNVEVTVDGSGVAEIVRHLALEKRMDLVVIGRGAMHEAFGTFRTHIYDVIREAPCPVISV